MNFESLPVVLQNLIRDAADAGTSGGNMYHIHANPAYKALSDDEKAMVNSTYYEAIKYAQEWLEEEEEVSSTINNFDLLA